MDQRRLADLFSEGEDVDQKFHQKIKEFMQIKYKLTNDFHIYYEYPQHFRLQDVTQSFNVYDSLVF